MMISDDRFPIALRFQPKWWRRACVDKQEKALSAALREFPGCDVYRQAWGLTVMTALRGYTQGRAAETVSFLNDRLEAAVEYACVDMADADVIDMAPAW